jgi:flagellar protein FlgJ
MDIPPVQSQIKASSVPFDQLAGNPHISEKDKIKESCRQFEAILLRQVLSEARKTVMGGKDSNETDIYNDMVNNQMADTISRSGSFGLAKSLENQLVRQVLPKSGDQMSTQPVSTPAIHSGHHNS